MICLYTDFGADGPYLGQVRAVLARTAPAVPIVDLMSDLPPFRPRGAAYLLAALVAEFSPGTVFLCVVDPGVGAGGRVPVVVGADGRWFVGPDNGLFDIVIQRGQAAVRREITWHPPRLSSTFHGRDLFAPVAASLAVEPRAWRELTEAMDDSRAASPEDLAEIVYVDRFGNLITGLRACTLERTCVLSVRGMRFPPGRTFQSVTRGQPVWYENSIGLAELAVNQGNAAARFGLAVGDRVEVKPSRG